MVSVSLRGRRGRALLDGFHQAKVDGLAGLEGAALGHPVEEMEELALQRFPVGGAAVAGPDPEHVHDAKRPAGGRSPSPRPIRWAGRGARRVVGPRLRLEGVGVALFDVEAVGGQEAAHDRQLGEVVEGHHGHVVRPGLARRHGDPGAPGGTEGSRKGSVASHGQGLLPSEVRGGQVGEKGEERFLVDFAAFVTQGRPDRFHQGGRGGRAHPPTIRA